MVVLCKPPNSSQLRNIETYGRPTQAEKGTPSFAVTVVVIVMLDNDDSSSLCASYSPENM
jgi:hypothetical protein